MDRSRNNLFITSLLSTIRDVFLKINMPQVKGNRKKPITLSDCLMSVLAMFSLKYPSLLSFDQDNTDSETVQFNIQNLFLVAKVPSDTYARERLDEVNPNELREPFKKIFAKIQGARALEGFQFIDGHYIVSIDGTGFFSSSNIHCKNCCEKITKKKDGTIAITYYHQMFCGAIVHPNKKTVIPFPPEPIMNGDGSEKNDCEQNAAIRFLKKLRKEHPHLKIIIVADSLFSTGPFIKALQENNMSYIIGAKEGNHKTLFDFVKNICDNFTSQNKNDKKTHCYSYINNVPINDSNLDVKVNFLDYTEIDKNNKRLRFTWVTDIAITKENAPLMAKGGRARWKIENETFNTLKNQGYNFEHNFGHGYKHLSMVFAMLMMLAFLIDQVQELGDPLFQKALLAKKRRKYLWEKLRALVFNFKISSWEDIWNALGHGYQAVDLRPLDCS